VAIAQNIDWYPGRYVGTFGVGAGTLVYQHAPQPRRQLLRLDPGDARPVAVGEEAFLANPAVSADGRQAIVDRFDASTNSSDLWMLDLGGGTGARLTFTARGTMDDTALFSPGGDRVALTELDADGVTRSWIQPTGGGARDGLVPESDQDFMYLTDWSHDGKALLTSPQRMETGQDVEVLRLDGDRKPVPLVRGPAGELAGRFSPNGRWVAYQSDESGRPEVYVTDYPAATAKWQVSTGGGSAPSWSADGRQLYYLAGDRVVAAVVHEGASFSAGAARPFDALGDRIVDFVVARSGRIVAVREIDPGKPPLTIVRNWQQLLGGR
jgi:Tol biopolymer transport system component